MTRRRGRRDDTVLSAIRVVVARLEGAARRRTDLETELRRLVLAAVEAGHPAAVVERAARLPMAAVIDDEPLPPFRPPEGPCRRPVDQPREEP